MWQAGIRMQAALVASWPAIGPVLPLIVFCCLCLAAVLVSPKRGQLLLVRFGVYLGILVSLVYLVCVLSATGPASPIAAAMVGIVAILVLRIVPWVSGYARRFTLAHLFAFTAVVAFGAAALGYLDLGGDLLVGVALVGLLVIASAPTLTFITYAWFGVLLFRLNKLPTAPVARRRTLFAWLAATFGGCIAWYASWRASLDVMTTEYVSLPSAVNCYVSTAAARGHQWLVKVDSLAGEGMRISRQTKRLKFLELAIRAAAPAAHQRLRDAYDAIGPSLARVCLKSVWFSDMTYVCLLPLELVAELLRCVARFPSSRIREIYSQPRIDIAHASGCD